MDGTPHGENGSPDTVVSQPPRSISQYRQKQSSKEARHQPRSQGRPTPTPEDGKSQLRASGNPERKEEKMEPAQPRTSAKNCPECGQPLTPRTNRTTKTEFLGCSNWPTCKYTEPMPQDIIMRRMNHPELPGF